MIEFGKTENVHWTLSVGDHDERNFDAFVAHLRGRFAETARPGDVSLTINCEGSFPNAARRKQLAETGAYLKRKGIQLPHAYVTNSRAGMGMMTAFRWVIKPDYPERAFMDPLRGLEWLATHAPDISPEQTLARIAQSARGFCHLEWAQRTMAEQR